MTEKTEDVTTPLLVKMRELGLAPVGLADGEQFDLDEHLIATFEDLAAKRDVLASTNEHIALISQKLLDAGLVTDVGDGLEQLDFLISRHKQLEGERDTLQLQVDDFTAKEQAAALAATGKAKAVPQKRSEKPRKIGPITLKNDETGPSAEEILNSISAAEVVEVAFSDGKNEIPRLAPQVIHGDAWFQQGQQVKLRLDTLQVFGPNRDEQSIVLDGYGLILDGKLVAYSSRMDKLVLAPGSINELKDDIVFNFG